jgi:hypothetical protein
MKRSPIVLLASLALSLLTPPARAWDATGHEVVARIAWEAMKPETRARAVALLKAAPPDADLASLLPDDHRPLAVRERQLFELASTWPDIVRDKAFPERMEKYNQPDWHHTDFFFEQPGPGAPPKERPDLTASPENVVEKLHQLEARLGDAGRPAAERAVDLAWVLHLVGDIHQPLHACSRVTPDSPKGDHGGGDFKLDADSLHWWWDQAISRSFAKKPGQSQEAYVGRVAHLLEARTPRRSRLRDLQPDRFEDWARRGYETCRRSVYPASLRPGVAPPADYADSAVRIAAPAVALAGYRLAEMLDRLL